MLINKQLITIVQKIKLIIFDVDGVMTDGRIYFTHNGEQMLSFYVHDGLGIKQVQDCGVITAVISGRRSSALQHRLNELNIPHALLGQHDKLTALNTLLLEFDIPLDCIAYVGDDLPDIPVMQKVGLPIAVANAVEPVKNVARFCTQKTGGNGAVREVCDFICAAIRS